MAFRREEAEKNREHKLHIPEIFARAAQLTIGQAGQTSTPRGQCLF